jgi:hypothetical protein
MSAEGLPRDNQKVVEEMSTRVWRMKPPHVEGTIRLIVSRGSPTDHTRSTLEHSVLRIAFACTV